MKPDGAGRLRLLFITTGLKTGGAEMVLLRLIGRLHPHMAISVVSLTDLGTVGPRLAAMGVPVTALDMAPGRPSVVAFLRLVRLIRRFKPNIVQTWMYHADLFGGLAARVAGVRQVVWGIHHSNVDADQNSWQVLAVVRICARLSASVPSAIVSCSVKAREIHRTAGYRSERFPVFPNGIDIDQFKPDAGARMSTRRSLGIPANAPLIGLIARFNVQKNHRGFFEAARLIHQSRPDAHFLLAGRGIDAENAELRAWYEAAGLTDVIRLCGDRDDVAALLAATDVLASPSTGEAFPNVLVEAMASGVPCATTDAGDSAEIVGNTGIVVPVGDMVGLHQAVLGLLAESKDAHASRAVLARARVVECFEIGTIAARYAAFYEGLRDC